MFRKLFRWCAFGFQLCETAPFALLRSFRRIGFITIVITLFSANALPKLEDVCVVSQWPCPTGGFVNIQRPAAYVHRFRQR
jgi:hypothetical protein